MLTIFKTKTVKELTGTEEIKILQIHNLLNADSKTMVNYQKLSINQQFTFLGLMFASVLLYKFISLFWYVLLIYPLRILLGYTSLLFVGVDLSLISEYLSFYLFEIYSYISEYFSKIKSIFKSLGDLKRPSSMPSPEKDPFGEDDVKRLTEMRRLLKELGFKDNIPLEKVDSIESVESVDSFESQPLEIVKVGDYEVGKIKLTLGRYKSELDLTIKSFIKALIHNKFNLNRANLKIGIRKMILYLKYTNLNHWSKENDFIFKN
jgi:hypothetical protein